MKTENAILESAMAYHKSGWAVIPLHGIINGQCTCGKSNCDSQGKHGLVSWKEYQNRKPTEDEIRTWFKQWTHANIGIVTGRISNIVVLDIDPKHGGNVSLDELQEQYGALPNTIEAQTGGGGRHLYFRYPGNGDIRNATAIRPGVDIRGEGGLVVAPPSLHKSGNHYIWESSSEPGEVELASFPTWLLNLQSENRKESKVIDERIPEGKRNDSLMSLAGSMQRRGMSQEAILAALHVENKNRCEPQLLNSELQEIAKSVSRYAPAESEHLTDTGNATRFVKMHRLNAHFCHPWGRWLIWDGMRWAVDDTGKVIRLAKETVQGIYYEASQEQEVGHRKKIAEFAMKSESEHRLNAMLSLARCELPALPEELDRDSWLFNVQNGTVDLRTGNLREHRREDMMTKLAPVDYDSEAKCPIWDEHLDRIMAGNEGLIDFLQRVVGYTLTGSVREQKLFFLHGAGCNGKTTFLKTLLALFGDYSKQCDPELLMMKKYDSSHPTGVADLYRTRLAVSIEVEESKRLAEVMTKQLTGGDRIAARKMHQDFFEFEPTHKFCLAANHKPIIRGTDLAIWRRIDLIPFNVTIPATEQDKDLSEKLKAELPGILIWAIMGCVDWQEKGLVEPAEVLAATQAYRSDMDILADFLSDCCIVDRTQEVRSAELQRAYKAWAEANAERPISARALGLRLEEKGFNKHRGTGGVRIWRGLTLKQPDMSDA